MAQELLSEQMLKVAVTRNYPDDELKAMDKQMLTQIAGYNGVATKASPQLQMMMTKRPITPADSDMAARVLYSAEYKSISHIRPDAYVQTHGGFTRYTSTQATLTETGGKQHVRENSPLPLPFGRRPIYPNVQPVAALCAQIVKNVSGEWQSAIDTQAWMKTYKTAVNPVGMQSVAQLVVLALSNSPMWKNLDSVYRNSIQGPEMLSFVATVLNALPELEYWLINCTIVFSGLRAMEKNSDGEWDYVLNAAGQRIVTDATYQFVEVSSREVQAALLPRFPAIVQYTGKLVVTVNFPESDGSFDSARASQARLREVQGSDNSCTSMLAAMRGYSGLTDAFGRRVQFLVSAVLSVWRLRRSVALQLHTVGDLSILVSSLNAWRRLILSSDSKVQGLFPSSSVDDAKKYGCEVRYLLPSASSKKNIPSVMYPQIVNRVDPGWVFVGFDEGTLPTSSKKGVKPDYDAYSQTLVPDTVGSEDYVMYSMVFGDYVFLNDPDVRRRRDNSLLRKIVDVNEKGKVDDLAFQVKYKPPFVYRFGVSSGFRGILSSLPNFMLTGYGHILTSHGQFDKTKEELHVIKVPLVKSMVEWYKFVCDDCALQSFMFFCPVVRYSGISNLIAQSKEAAVMQLRIVPMEEGLSIPNSIVREESTVRMKVNFNVKIPSSAASPSSLPLSELVVSSTSVSQSSQPQPSDTSEKSSTASTTSVNLDKFDMANMVNEKTPVDEGSDRTLNPDEM